MGNSPLKYLSFDSNRRFGVELEILAFDKKSRPVSESLYPKGTDYVTVLTKNNVQESVFSKKYEKTDKNTCWVVKPDSTCGIEICSPPLKGWRGIKKVCDLVNAYSKDEKIQVDERCSVHVHIEVKDLSEKQLATVIAYWIKCEPLFMDMVPSSRKKNRYSQLMGMTTLFEHDYNYCPSELIDKVGEIKYYSLNCNQLKKNNRMTLEVRIIEGNGCKDPFLLKNWLRLIIHFIERTSKLDYPFPYQKGNNWSSLLWLDTNDFLKVLGFNKEQFDLSPGLIETRNWMLARLYKFMMDENIPRKFAKKELEEFIDFLKLSGTVINNESLYPQNLDNCLYNFSN